MDTIYPFMVSVWIISIHIFVDADSGIRRIQDGRKVDILYIVLIGAVTLHPFPFFRLYV